MYSAMVGASLIVLLYPFLENRNPPVEFAFDGLVFTAFIAFFAAATDDGEAAPEDVACAKTYLGLNREEGYIRGMIRGCMGSVSRLCVVQMQDYLELGKEARMNFPGTLSSANWTWRAEKGFDSDALAARIYAATKLYGRVGK